MYSKIEILRKTLEYRNDLAELTNNLNFIIQKADKVNMFVILDNNFYFEKLVKCDHLNANTYVEVDSNSNKKVFSKLNGLIDKHSECLS